MKRYYLIGFLLILMAGIGLRVVGIAQTNPTNAIGLPLVDDAFYYFSLGRNVASGAGVRIDAVHPTNGFQPLWGALVTLPYVIFRNSDTLPIIAIQFIGIALGLSTALVIFQFARELTDSTLVALLAMGLWFLAPESIVNNLNGMETSLAVLTSITFFYAIFRVYKNKTLSAVCVAGVVAGVAFLARIDTLALAAAALCIMLLRPPNPARWKTIGLFAVCILPPILPWAALTLAMGKSILPESGQAVRLLAVELGKPTTGPIDLTTLLYRQPNSLTFFQPKLVRFIGELARQLYPLDLYNLLRLDETGVFVAAVLSTGIFIALLLILTRRQKRTENLLLLWLLSTGALLFLYSFYVLDDWFFRRYALPLSHTLGILGSIVILNWIISVGKYARLKRIGGAIYLVLVGLAYLVMLTSDINYNWIFNGPSSIPDDGLYTLSNWINEHVPATGHVGAFQSGLVGYYSNIPVINLDGKVNVDAYHAMLSGQMDVYLCRTHIDYVVDLPVFIEKYLVNRTSAPLSLEKITNIPSNLIAGIDVDQVHCP